MKLPQEDLKVKWLFEEVRGIYDTLYETGKLGNEPKKEIACLKTLEGLPSMDYYLTNLDNSLHPIKENTLLSVHYTKESNSPNHSKGEISKNSFQYLKVIGSGGYSNVVLARKKDTGKLFAIKIIKKDSTYLKTNKRIYLAEVNIMKRLIDIPHIVGLHYTFQTQNELYFAMDP